VTIHRLRVAFLTGLLAALIACASPPPPPPPPPKPTQLTGSIEVSTKVNPSASQRPSPLLLRVYELKSAATFNGADFISLFQRDQAELGADLVAREEYVLTPGETKAFIKTLSPDTRFLGVMGAFRDLDRSQWRSVVAVDPKKNQQVIIRAAALAVDATVSTAAK
jgi:type VI secretion system protein VasD